MASSGTLAVALRTLRGASRVLRISTSYPATNGKSSFSVQPCRHASERARRVYSYPKDESGDIVIDEQSVPVAKELEEEKVEVPGQEVGGEGSSQNLEQEMSRVLEQQLASKSVESEQHRKNSSAELSFLGISSEPFPAEVESILLKPIKSEDVELKPDGTIYLPEIKYRRILHQAFGPGGWALMPRGEPIEYHSEGAHLVTREYALFCRGRFISQSVGEHVYYAKNDLNIGKALESAKSNALMRCCKDLGIASELWDPQYVAAWKVQHGLEVWCENSRTREKKKLWKRKNSKALLPFPWKEAKSIPL